jgi:hypothetical protein
MSKHTRSNPHGRRKNLGLFADRGRVPRGSQPTLAGFDQLEQRLAFAVSYASVNDWGSGLQADLMLTNDTKTTLTDWQLTFNYNRSINSIWNAVIVSRVGTRYVIKNAPWNGTIAPGAEISFGFQADGIAGELPSNKKVNGVLVA